LQDYAATGELTGAMMNWCVRILLSAAFFLITAITLFGAVGHPDAPTKESISRLRIFEEPLQPIGGEPLDTENRELTGALQAYGQRRSVDDFSSLTRFLERHPKSAWQASLLTSLGTEYYNTAHYSKALAAWQKGWELGRNATEPQAKAVMDRTAGELAYMYARLGRMEELEALLKSVEGRMFIGAATEKISGAREGLWNMRHRPEIAFRCGPLALHRIKAVTGPSLEADLAIHRSASTRQGMSLSQVMELSRQVGLNYQMAFREKGAAFIVPSVVHWKVGHYAAMTRREGPRFLLQDPTFGNDAWATTNALESETSGYFLIPSGPLPSGWRAVDGKEGGTIWGKGVTSNNDPNRTSPDDPKTSPCSGSGGGAGPAPGMAVPSVHLMLVNLNINDTPVGYSPPVGPAVGFTVRYNHREAAQPATFTYANFGAKWTCDWLSYITDNPQSPSADVNYFVRGGGTKRFTGFDTNAQRFAPQLYGQARLTRTGTNSYEMAEGNGARMIFGRSDGASGTSRKIFLTQIIDPFGNTVTLNYDASLRLTNIVDAIGQATTLSYSNASDSFKITRVTDPFGRFAEFQYDSLGRLTNITDVIGIKSRFLYEGGGDFINALVTPYGTTSFTRGEAGGTRWMETMYPDGSKERVEYNQSSNLGVPFSEPAGLVPQGVNTFNQWLYARNTYFWSRTACAQAYGDYTKAKIYHWLHELDLNTTAGVLESIKEPLEGRVWFDYAGQSAALYRGTSDQPRHIGRVLDDSSTQLYTYERNEFGHVTNSIDPVGRTVSYIYATNGIDLLEMRMTRAGKNELLFKATYNAQHQPLTTTDAAGQTTTNTYNARGQLLTTSNPKGETTAYTYNTNGYLIAVDGPLPGTNDTLTATYDTFGRTRTKTDDSGYSITLNYDALDRVTNITFPDATFQQVTFNRLDPSIVRDRAGRQTILEHDAMRQLVKRTDALNRITRFEWCSCGDIKSLTDPMNRTTQWHKDVQGRLTAKEYGDGSRITYHYERLTGRRREVIDEKSQVQQFAWNVDNSLRSVRFVNPAVPTPPVSYTYDADYPRVISHTDLTGIRQFQYHPITPIPALGAGKLASVDGPLVNDTMAFDYDELGRRIASSIDGVAHRIIYDAAQRVIGETNALGSFSYSYESNTMRRLTETFPNGLVKTWGYEEALHDFHTKQLTHQVGASTVSQFVYERDHAADRIVTWSQQLGAEPAQVFALGYDAVDQLLTAAVTNGGAFAGTFAYSYDAAGNRLREQTLTETNVATYNALNQLSVVSGNNGVARTNEWDARGRLAAVNAGNRRTEFAYDAADQLVSLRLLTNGIEVSMRRFVWLDQKLTEERDAAGVVTKRFFAQGVKIESGTNAGIYFYTRDHLGSIREVLDANGTVRARYTYDPYGRRTRVSGDLKADFGFAGMFWSSEAQLSLTLYRAYDPQLGRWLSRDPLRNAEQLEGPNLYAYVGNNPINATDPLGLCCEKEAKDLADARSPLFTPGISPVCDATKIQVVNACSYSIPPSPVHAQNCQIARQMHKSLCEDPLQQRYLECLARPCGKLPCGQAGYGGGKLGRLPDVGGGIGPGEIDTSEPVATASTSRPAERNAADRVSYNADPAYVE
jgi:RHS repeat-associated protein